MGRVEGMADDATFGMLTGGLHRTHGQSGGTRSDNRIRRSCSIHLCEELYLEILPFGSVLLHQVGICKRLLHVRRELQMIARRVGGKPDGCEVLPCGIDVTAQVALRIGRRIRCDDVETPREVERCPARTDDACAYDCYVLNLLTVCHETSPPRVLIPGYRQILCCCGSLAHDSALRGRVACWRPRW